MDADDRAEALLARRTFAEILDAAIDDADLLSDDVLLAVAWRGRLYDDHVATRARLIVLPLVLLRIHGRDAADAAVRCNVAAEALQSDPTAADDVDLLGTVLVDGTAVARLDGFAAHSLAAIAAGRALRAMDALDKEHLVAAFAHALAVGSRATGNTELADEAIAIADEHTDIDLDDVLVDALERRHRARRDPADLTRAIATARQAQSRHPTMARRLPNLLLSRFRTTGDAAALDEAIALLPDEESYGTWWKRSVLFAERYRATGDGEDLEAALDATDRGLAESSPAHPAHLPLLGRRAELLGEQYARRGDLATLDDAVHAAEAVLGATDERDPAWPARANALASRLKQRLDRRGDHHDLDRAISLLERAVESVADGTTRSPLLANLAMRLVDRYDHTNDIVLLDRAVALATESVVRAPLDVDGVSRRVLLADALQRRSTATGSADDLDRAVVLLNAAVEVTPSGSIHRLGRLNDLALALDRRFERSADPRDLDRAIALLDEALALDASSGPQHAARLGNLGKLLARRFSLAGDVADLERATTVTQRAVDELPAGSPSRIGYMNNLAARLLTRFRLERSTELLDAAVATFETVLDSTPPTSAQLPARQNNFAIVLSERYRARGGDADLDRAITLIERARAASAAPSPLWIATTDNLARRLAEDAARRRDARRADQAVELARTAVASSAGASRANDDMFGLALTLATRYEITADRRDHEEARALVRRVLDATPPVHAERRERETLLARLDR